MVSLPIVWACGAFSLEGPRGAAPCHHDHPPWVEVEPLAPSHCASRCLERSDDGVSAFEAEGFVDDIAAFVEGRNTKPQGGGREGR